MIEIAQHIRIFEKQPSDELVEKRTAAIEALAKKFSELANTAEILQLACDLTVGISKGSTLPEPRQIEIEAVIRENSSSFVREGQHLQLLTCSYLAALKMLSNAAPSVGVWTRSDVLALGLWSGLSLQTPRSEQRLEALRQEVFQASRQLVQRSSLTSRQRQEVVELPKSADALPAFRTGAAKTIDALQTNAALDREELDLLWWVLSDWSALAQKKYTGMSTPAAAIIAAFDAARMMRRLPADSHKHLVFRYVRKDQKLTLKKMIEDLRAEVPNLNEKFSEAELLATREPIFPVVSACLKLNVGGDLLDRTLSLSDWASHALLECSILHIGTLTRKLI